MSLSAWMKRLLAKPSRASRPFRSTITMECLEGRITPASIASGVPIGSAPVVRVLDATTLQPVATVNAYDSGFTGGVNVALADVTGDGVADLITGTTTGSSHVKVFDGVTFQQVKSFLAFPGFTGGVNVAGGDVNGDGKADIVVSVASGGPPQVAVFSGADGSVLRSFLAYDSGFLGGVRVAVGDVDGDGKADITT
ncbi:MAG TPA: VCBS repeat-containing protein, partial [Gemmata sp.]